MTSFIISSKGQVLIPKRLREKYGIEPGVKVTFEETNDGLLIKAVDKNYFRKFRGILNSSGNFRGDMKSMKSEELMIEESKLA
jgi:AbrB family looped-hinge helix DNA binding protein